MGTTVDTGHVLDLTDLHHLVMLVDHARAVCGTTADRDYYATLGLKLRGLRNLQWVWELDHGA